MTSRIECDDRVMDVVADALQRPPEERELFVQQACNGDAALVCAVNDELAWEANNASFLNEPWLEFTRLISPFTAGQIVNDRFEIVREIGEGGMGMVYEAFDRRLQQRFAIKAAKPGFQRLLSPELRSALRISHRNICRENELHNTKTEWGEIDFLTMEFIEGDTLSAHLKNAGKLNHEEALDIACQLCAGLMEAHQRGIIHRDLKSGNVMLCQNEDGSRRAVITDFGLAGPSTSSAEIAGTPAYMAPELWRGEPASKLSDIYALGVILYEMVAGRKPYQREDAAELGKQKTITLAGESVAESADGRESLIQVTKQEWEKPQHTRPPMPPSAWTKGLDPRWDRVIMRCLELDPTKRTQHVGAVLTDLRRKRIRKWPFAVAGTVLLALAAVVGLVRPLRQWVMDFISPPNVRLAVLPYDGPPEFASVAGGALQEAAERIQQLPGGRRTVAVFSPSRLTSARAKTPQQARDALHATHALQLTLRREAGDAISAHTSVLDLSSQLAVKELQVNYSNNDLGAIPAALAGLVAQAFRLREPSVDDKLAPAASEPYLRGVYLLNRDELSFDEAIEQFQRAALLDPNSALPAAGMALALAGKFNVTKQSSHLEQAQQYLHIAQSRSPDSVRVLLAAGTVDSASSQPLRALQDYARVQELDPRNVDALLGLGSTYADLREPDQAIAAFRKAQELDPEYYRPYQKLGTFYWNNGRHAEAADQYRKMVERAPGLPDAYSALGAALIDLRQYPGAEAALQQSLQHGETALALNNLGALRAFQGRYAEAAAYQKRALAYEPDNFTWLLNEADNLRWAGDASDALPYYRKARDRANIALTLNPQSGRARGFFAYTLARLGDRERAEDEIRQAISLQPENQNLELAIRIYEAFGDRNLALQMLNKMTPAGAKDLCPDLDLAGFCQDPRYKQEMTNKGGQ